LDNNLSAIYEHWILPCSRTPNLNHVIRTKYGAKCLFCTAGLVSDLRFIGVTWLVC